MITNEQVATILRRLDAIERTLKQIAKDVHELKRESARK